MSVNIMYIGGRPVGMENIRLTLGKVYSRRFDGTIVNDCGMTACLSNADVVKCFHAISTRKDLFAAALKYGVIR